MKSKTKLFWTTSIIIIFLLLITPIAAYVWYFRNSVITTDPQAWGVLGDFFGGILNPIISLASLCVLGYLTYLIAKQTTRESKNLFILERRMLAFDELAKHVKEINSFTPKMDSIMAMVPVYEKLPNEQAIIHMVKVFEELREVGNTYRNFHYTLFEFNPRYGHLFKYDFNSKEYKELLAESKRISNLMATLVTDPDKIKNEDRKELTIPVRFSELVFNVFVKIREEVNVED